MLILRQVLLIISMKFDMLFFQFGYDHTLCTYFSTIMCIGRQMWSQQNTDYRTPRQIATSVAIPSVELYQLISKHIASFTDLWLGTI